MLLAVEPHTLVETLCKVGRALREKNIQEAKHKSLISTQSETIVTPCEYLINKFSANLLWRRARHFLTSLGEPLVRGEVASLGGPRRLGVHADAARGVRVLVRQPPDARTRACCISVCGYARAGAFLTRRRLLFYHANRGFVRTSF